MTALDVPPIPEGLDARPVVRFTLHCSHCGSPHEGEYGVDHWPAEALTDLGKYTISEDGWYLDVDGRKLVCPACEVGFCPGCGESIFAWQPVRIGNVGGDTYHQGCEDEA